MKIKEFQQILQQGGADFALFYQTDRKELNMVYFTGYSGFGALVVPARKQPFLIVPKMELTRAKQSFHSVYLTGDKSFFESVHEIVRKNKIGTKKIAINKRYFTLHAYKEYRKSFVSCACIDISKQCSDLRIIKTDREIEILRKACRISDAILDKCITKLKTFHNESDVAAFLECEARKKGCEIAFTTIIASGKHAAMPHHITSNSKLLKGFCVIDFGIVYQNYCTDTSRTVYLGKPSKKDRDLYNLVLNAQKLSIENIKPKVKCGTVHKIAVKALRKCRKYFIHGLGHGLGLGVHEQPSIVEQSSDKFKEGMVFTIEPGIYFKEIGIRIEDDVVLRKGKTEILTKASKNLIVS